MFGFYDRSRRPALLSTTVLMFSLVPSLTSGVASAQMISASKEAPTFSRSYVDYLQGLALAKEGSRPEALRLLEDSLRLQPQDNPAAALIFELLTEQRANTPLRFLGHTGTIMSASFSTDGTKIVTASLDHTARVWDARTGAQLAPPLEHEDEVISAAFSADGKRVVTGSSESKVRIWDAVTGKPLTDSLEVHGSVLCVSFSPDGKIVAAGTDDGKLRTWDAATGKTISPIVLYHEEVYSLTFNRDGSQLLVATGDNKAELVDPRTGYRLLHPLRHGNIVRSAQFSADFQHIVTASGDESARTWDAKTVAPTGVILRHGFAVEAAAFNPDATRVVTASMDHTARVWDAKTGAPISAVMQHPAPVERASFSPDGRLVATVAADGAIRVWDASTGEAVLIPIRGSGNEHFANFSPNGLSLLAVDGASMQIVDMPPHAAPPSWLLDLADFASTQSNYNQSRLPDVAKLHALRTQLLSATGNDPWTLFGKWYFAEPAQRPLTPWSQENLESYVNLLIEKGDRESLEYAGALAHDHPSWMAKINPLLVKLRASTPPITTAHREN